MKAFGAGTISAVHMLCVCSCNVYVAPTMFISTTCTVLGYDIKSVLLVLFWVLCALIRKVDMLVGRTKVGGVDKVVNMRLVCVPLPVTLPTSCDRARGPVA